MPSFYSMDRRHARAPYDPDLGLKRLERLLKRHASELKDLLLERVGLGRLISAFFLLLISWDNLWM